MSGYGDVEPPTQQDWEDAFGKFAPGCHHPAPPPELYDKALIDDIDSIEVEQ